MLIVGCDRDGNFRRWFFFHNLCPGPLEDKKKEKYMDIRILVVVIYAPASCRSVLAIGAKKAGKMSGTKETRGRGVRELSPALLFPFSLFPFLFFISNSTSRRMIVPGVKDSWPPMS